MHQVATCMSPLALVLYHSGQKRNSNTPHTAHHCVGVHTACSRLRPVVSVNIHHHAYRVNKDKQTFFFFPKLLFFIVTGFADILLLVKLVCLYWLVVEWGLGGGHMMLWSCQFNSEDEFERYFFFFLSVHFMAT